ncbi:MAG: Wadjet anti-phage system protein JetD domain-containing protein, partial [Spirochaetota bacterium]
DTVFIVENDITALSFPEVEGGVVIFGRGYGFDCLRGAAMLAGARLVYWGDTDTHGFAILNQFRETFPTAGSLLMDRETFEACRTSWVTEPSPVSAHLKNLSEEESSMYDDLAAHVYGAAVRLEQEYVPYEMIMKELERRGFTLVR